jgi:N-acyl amino acid synthase of PEP-CTERM/exosortase system
MSLIVKKAETQEELEASYRLRYEVYVKKLGWLANSYARKMEIDEQDFFGNCSTFIAYKDDVPVSKGIIGVIRAIYPDENEALPVVRDFSECAFPQTKRCCEVSRFIASDVFKVLNVEEKTRFPRHCISLALIRLLYRETKYEKRVSHWFASLDVTVLGLIRFLGFPFEEVGEAKFYMGSLTAPVVLVRQKLERSLAKNPSLYRYLNGDKDGVAVEEAGLVLASSL